MQNLTFTEKDKQRYETLVETVRHNEFGMLKWAKALWEIKQQGFWKTISGSWPEYCEKIFGYSKSKAYDWVSAVEFVENQKLISQTSEEEIEIPKTVTRALQLKRGSPGGGRKIPTITDNNPTLLPAPAKLDKTPLALKPNGSPVLPNDLRGLMDKIFKDVDHILHRTDISYEAMTELRKLYTEVNQARQMLQGILPGMEEVVSKPKFRRPSLEEVQLYCEKAGICGRDADWFWNKMEGTGWKNGGKPVVDWGRTLIAWKLAAYLPSMKTFTANGQQVPKQKTIIQQDMDRLKASMSRL